MAAGCCDDPFSLFRHPPRVRSADATFPRWGKDRRTTVGHPYGRGRNIAAKTGRRVSASPGFNALYSVQRYFPSPAI